MRPKCRLLSPPFVMGSLAVLLCLPMGLCAARKIKVPKARKAPSLEFTARVDEQVAIPGDTLWAMCERATGKPYVWPRVWAMNPGITNPHWIYPGDVVRFNPNVPIKPRQATLVASDMDIPQASEQAADRQTQGPTVEIIAPPPPPSRDKTHMTQRIANVMWVTPQELEASGRLTNALPDHVLLALNDRIFVTFPKQTPFKVGDRFLVYRTRAEVNHPLTGRRVGYMSEVTGIATVDAVEKDVGRARLTGVAREVERGNYLMPFTEDTMVTVTPKPASKSIEAVVLAVEDDTAVAGEQRRVFIDKGKNDGLERGARLAVQSHGDPVTDTDKNFPDTDLAQLVVIDSKDTASTCLVVDAYQEVWPGDPVYSIP